LSRTIPFGLLVPESTFVPAISLSEAFRTRWLPAVTEYMLVLVMYFTPGPHRVASTTSNALEGAFKNGNLQISV
jgi:hypothetical protein